MKAIICVLITMLAPVLCSGGVKPHDVAPGEDLSLYVWTEPAAAEIASAMDSAFGVYEIPAPVEARMRDKSYPRGCPIAMSALRYLIIPHYDGHGYVRLGEMVCHRDVAADIIAIFRELYAERYPIERMVLIDDYDADDERSMAANNTSCFCYRNVAGSRSRSRHSYGKAVDINPLYNPFVRRGQSGQIITPADGRRWADRSRSDIPYAVRRGDAAWRAFTSRGWQWGGSWRTRKDYQHFQKRN